MKSVTFIGDPAVTDNRASANDPDTLTFAGMDFPLNTAVKIDEASSWWKRYGTKLEGNAHFRVSGIAKKADAELTGEEIADAAAKKSEAAKKAAATRKANAEEKKAAEANK